jgi:hypothetical protein
MTLGETRLKLVDGPDEFSRFARLIDYTIDPQIRVTLSVLGCKSIRENDDFSGEPGGARLLHYPETVQPRHPSVGYDQLKIIRIFFHTRNGGAAVGGNLNVVAGGLQRLGKHVEHEHVVIGTKDA